MPKKVSESKRKLENYCKIRNNILDATICADAAVVDGVHDRETLRRLGFSKPVFTRSKYSYSELVDRLAKKFSTVIILTDFDAEGELANVLIGRLLEERNVRVLKACRNTVGVSLKEVNTTTVEGIYKLII
jgi:5S rRNA maturation endonuclease (ribonuclease M5)